MVKSIQKKKNDLEANIQSSTSETEAEIPTWASMSSEATTYPISTSNSFDILSNMNNEEEAIEKPVEKPAVKPDESNNKSSDKPSPRDSPTPTSSKHDSKSAKKPNNKQNETDAETIILCDSNGRFIKPNSYAQTRRPTTSDVQPSPTLRRLLKSTTLRTLNVSLYTVVQMT